MVELATRVALGEKLKDLGWTTGLLPASDLVAVKAPVFSTTKLRGVDPMLGPAMQSAGEVIGIHADVNAAMAKALVAASLRPPIPHLTPSGARPLALLSIADRDKEHLPELAARLHAAGYGFCATSGTARSLRVLGFDVEEVARLDQDTGARTVIDAISSTDVLMVINTPSHESRPVKDDGAIRMAATAEGILCLTSIDTALAAAGALDPRASAHLDDVRSLDDWVSPQVARTG